MRELRIALLAVVSLAVAGAQTPDAQGIMQHIRLAYGNLTSYQMHLSMEVSETSPDSEMNLKTPLIVAWERGGSFRAESKGPSANLMISNGRDIWDYNAAKKQYSKVTSGLTMHDAFASVTTGAPLFPDSNGRKIRTLELAPDEDVPVAGSPHPCYVLKVQYLSDAPAADAWAHAATFWVDKSSYLILKRAVEWHQEKSTVKASITLVSQDTNLHLPASTFAFEPPPGTELVTRGGTPGQPSARAAISPAAAGAAMVGKRAPAFSLRDLNDRDWQLSNLRGQVVLMDFWATWCGPCRAEIPIIEKLHRKEKDVVVLGVDVGEDPDLVRKFITQQKVTYPILLGGDDRMVGEYKARAFPSVVILDPNGVIRTYKTGYGEGVEKQLREALDGARHAQGVAPPQVLSKSEPEYTEEALKAHITGSVTLHMMVSKQGVPGDIQVVHGLGYGLDERAAAAVKDWRFDPALKDGQPVAMEASVEVSFRLLHERAQVQHALGAEPKTAEEAYRMGSQLMQAGQADAALALFDKAIAWRPDWAEALHARGHAHYRTKEYEAAILDFNAAIKLDGTRAAWWDDRGLAYAYSGHQLRAIEDYNHAIELNAQSAAPYNNRGWAYLETGQPARAIDDLTKAIEISPAFLKPYENRAKAYAALQDWTHTIADYTAAIQLSPARWQYEKRAEARRASGDSAGADADMRLAAQMPAASH